MSDSYRMKLRSAARAKSDDDDDLESQQRKNTETDESPELEDREELGADDSSSPQTPPSGTDVASGSPSVPNLEAFFPPSPYGRKRQQIYGDRFIPIRERNIGRDFQLVEPYPASGSRQSNSDSEYQPQRDLSARRLDALYLSEIFGDHSAADEFTHSGSPSTSRTPRRFLQYSNIQRTPTSSTDYSTVLNSPTPRFRSSPISDAGLRILAAHRRPPRRISRTPIKVLDAPDLQDDFYLNLIDWGPDDNLAVGLGPCVYLWNAATSRVTKLCDFLDTDRVTSVGWAQQGPYLAIGTNQGHVYLWDVEAGRRVRSWANHRARVGSVAWCSNILTSGGRDHHIYHRDLRSPSPHFRQLTGHTQEVCGIKWSLDGTLLASGGNDNTLLIWGSHQNIISHRFTDHLAAIKAIDWSPHNRGILVSGGGTADKTIKFWNAISGSLLSSHDTGSQVCNIAWSKITNEIVSTHGYSSNSLTASNQVVVWKANKMQRLATLTGHQHRVLYMSMSKDGSTVVTGAGDETLRFWDVFSSVDTTPLEPEDRQSCLR